VGQEMSRELSFTWAMRLINEMTYLNDFRVSLSEVSQDSELAAPITRNTAIICSLYTFTYIVACLIMILLTYISACLTKSSSEVEALVRVTHVLHIPLIK
jgi:hypothetical protein